MTEKCLKVWNCQNKYVSLRLNNVRKYAKLSEVWIGLKGIIISPNSLQGDLTEEGGRHTSVKVVLSHSRRESLEWHCRYKENFRHTRKFYL